MDILQKWLSYDDSDEFGLTVDGGSFNTQQPFVDVTVNGSGNSSEVQHRILINRYRSSRLCFKPSSPSVHPFALKKEHPLLWDYNDAQGALYFSGGTLEVHKLIWELTQIDMSLYERYLPPFHYFNHNLNELLKVRSGLLANGPVTLLLKYAACIKQFGFSASILDKMKPTYWDGRNSVEEQNTAQILLLGDSYIIADGFEVIKL